MEIYAMFHFQFRSTSEASFLGIFEENPNNFLGIFEENFFCPKTVH